MFSKLHNIYWFLRCTRNKSARRKYYHWIVKERQHLLDLGVDAEDLRLYCRSLSSRHNEFAEKRLRAYESSLHNGDDKKAPVLIKRLNFTLNVLLQLLNMINGERGEKGIKACRDNY